MASWAFAYDQKYERFKTKAGKTRKRKKQIKNEAGTGQARIAKVAACCSNSVKDTATVRNRGERAFAEARTSGRLVGTRATNGSFYTTSD